MKLYTEGNTKIIETETGRVVQTDQPSAVNYPNTATIRITLLETNESFQVPIIEVEDKEGVQVATTREQMIAYIGASFSSGGSRINLTTVLQRISEDIQAPPNIGNSGNLTVKAPITQQPDEPNYISYDNGIITFEKSANDARISLDTYVSKASGGAGVSELLGWAQTSVDNGVTWVLANNAIATKSNNDKSASTLLTFSIVDVVEGLKLRFRIGIPSDSDIGARLEPRAATGLTELPIGVPSVALTIQIPI